MKALDTKKLRFTWRNWGRVTDQGYAIQYVLIPEVIIELVRQDMDVGREEALW
jgi:hypothetical protein